ncbi:hypothetical protein DPMN_109971 [Dreissena polymorpha]|uniref:Uncharacterized protein n=1 Tax=Dreissena polymorpha TaxID=45954 RepID=A0A9D4KB85_DREPO|nr:hypothetical protein DPMN_109971 [Dreissena polymorpha]
MSKQNQRYGIDIFATANCILDPFVYVLWFRECRMELLKMLAGCLPTSPYLQDKIEKMRVEIFCIST